MKKSLFLIVAILCINLVNAQVQVVNLYNDGQRTSFQQTIGQSIAGGEFYKRICYLDNKQIAVSSNYIMYDDLRGTSIFNFWHQSAIFLFNPDGSLNQSFMPNTELGDAVKIEEIKSNIVIDKPTSAPRNKATTSQISQLLIANHYLLRKLNMNGTIDNNFLPIFVLPNQSSMDNRINDFVVQKDGKIVVCGTFTNVNGENIRAIVRLNTDGSIDNSFQRLDALFSSGYKLHLQPDNKILFVAKYATDNNIRLIRLNENGIVDFTFLNANTDIRWNQTHFYPQDCDLELQSDGKIVASNFHGFYNYKLTQSNKRIGGLIRFNANGTLDNSFSHKIIQGSINQIEIDNKDRIYVCGEIQNDVYPNTSVENANKTKKIIVRLEPNGNNILPFISDNSYNISYITGLKLNKEKNKIMSIGAVNAQINIPFGNRTFQACHFEFHISDLLETKPFKDVKGNGNIINRINSINK